jgi:hypothetical protein
MDIVSLLLGIGRQHYAPGNAKAHPRECAKMKLPTKGDLVLA